MKSGKSLLIPILAALLLPTLAFAAPSKVLPRLKLQVGQKFKLRASSDSKMTNTVNGQKQVILDSASVVFAFELLSVDEVGDMAIKVTYDSIRLNEEAPGGKVAYDSTLGGEVQPLVRGLASLVGQSVTMRISPDGRVRSVTGADELVAKGIEKYNALSEPWRSSMSKILQDRFGNQPTSEMMQGLFGVYPEQPVAVGERWSRKFSMSIGTAECFYKITDRKNGVLNIKTYATVTPDPDAPPIQMGLSLVKSELNGKQEGTLQLDEATGIPVGSKDTNSSSGNLVIVQGGSEIRIPSSSTSTTTVEKL